MSKLKLGPIEDDKPVKLTVELPAPTYRDLVAYAKAVEQEMGQAPIEPARLIAPMIARFIATDRGFAKARRAHTSALRDVTRSSVPNERDKQT